MPLEYKLFYQRHLPHFQPPGARLFVTFRLAGSLPKIIIQQLIEEKIRLDAKHSTLEKTQKQIEEDRSWKYLFGKMDENLSKQSSGPLWLNDPGIAAIVAESLHFCNNRQYELDNRGKNVHDLSGNQDKHPDSCSGVRNGDQA